MTITSDTGEMLRSYMRGMTSIPTGVLAGWLCDVCQKDMNDCADDADCGYQETFDPYGIKLVVTPIGGELVIEEVRLMVAGGGPNIWLHIGSHYADVHGYWGSAREEMPMTDVDGTQVLEYYSEIMGSLQLSWN